jgi:hypothetical protein
MPTGDSIGKNSQANIVTFGRVAHKRTPAAKNLIISVRHHGKHLNVQSKDRTVHNIINDTKPVKFMELRSGSAPFYVVANNANRLAASDRQWRGAVLE